MTFEVNYIGDYAYRLPVGAFLVEKDADYVNACRLLAINAPEEKPLKIWVRKHHLYAWLKNYCEMAQLACRFSEKTARLVLAEVWGVTVPEWLTDGDVVSMNLLDLEVKNEQPCRFEEALLGHFLGPAFRGERLARDRIAGMVVALARKETGDLFDHYPLLLRCLREQGQVWSLHTDPHWEKTLISLLIGNPEDLWRDLSLWALLSGYPAKLLEYVVTPQQAGFLRSIPVEIVKHLSLERKAVEDATTQMEMFFQDIGQAIDSGNAFRKVVQCTSGRLTVEFRLVKSLLTDSRFAPAQADLVAVKEKFRQCVGLDATELTTIDYLVMPKRPGLPDKNALHSPSAWVSWAVEAYIPYRHWQTKSGHDDVELEETVQAFTDWYIRDYATIHQNAEMSLVHALGTFRDCIQSDTLSLIILADGVPLTFWPIFEDALRKAGLHRHTLEYRFAPLPTDTEFVKPALVSGVWNPLQKSYEALLQERTANDWNGKRIVYLSDLKMLADFSAPGEPTVVFLNLLASDEILHGEPEMKGETHEGELYRLFMRVGDAISTLLERWSGQRESFGLYVLTDHGAGFIMDSEKQTFESKIISKLFTDERRRFAVIEKETADTVPANLWDLGYRFVPPFVKGEKVFFIPRGHGTVRAGGMRKGYAHGGATPEEVIVPVAFFKATKAAWKSPSARFLDLRIDTPTGKAVFHVQRLISLQMEMLNPNVEDIRVVRVAIMKPKTELKGQDLPMLTKGQATIVRLDCYFERSSLGQEELVLQFVYEIAGEERVMEMKLEAEFRSAVTGGFSLKDLQ